MVLEEPTLYTFIKPLLLASYGYLVTAGGVFSCGCVCVSFHREHPNGVRVGLHNSNLLLRSCTIRNTETVVGIVVYAGVFIKLLPMQLLPYPIQLIHLRYA